MNGALSVKIRFYCSEEYLLLFKQAALIAFKLHIFLNFEECRMHGLDWPRFAEKMGRSNAYLSNGLHLLFLESEDNNE